MANDSTSFLFPSSGTWVADWEGATCQDMRDSLGEYRLYTVTVRRREGAPRPEAPEGFDRVVSNGRKAMVLRHASTGNTVIMLRVETVHWLARGRREDGGARSRRVVEEIPPTSDRLVLFNIAPPTVPCGVTFQHL